MNSEAKFFNPHEVVSVTNFHLPHWDQGNVYYFVTWRLGDSVPAEKSREYQEEKEIWRKLHPPPWGEDVAAEYHKRFFGKFDEWLDAGSGSCVLRDPEAAEIVANALRFFDGDRYVLECFVIMPNHVHVLFALRGDYKLTAILRSWKGFSAKMVNRHLSREGSLWQADSWDRIIRNERHFLYCRDYIRKNPAKAGLKVGEYVYSEK